MGATSLAQAYAQPTVTVQPGASTPPAVQQEPSSIPDHQTASKAPFGESKVEATVTPVQPPGSSSNATYPAQGYPVQAHYPPPPGPPQPAVMYHTGPPPPPQGHYPPNYQPNGQPMQFPGTTMIVFTRGMPPPDRVHCLRCNHIVTPLIRHTPGGCSWLVAAALCFVGCWCISCIPFLEPSTQDRVYSCPQCNAELFRVNQSPF